MLYLISIGQAFWPPIRNIYTKHSEHTRTRNSKYIIIFSIFVMSASGRINELPNNYSHNHLQQWRQAQKTSRRPWCYRLAGLTSWSNTVADQSWMFPNDVTVATFTCTVHLTIQALVYRKCIKCNTKTFQPWTQEWCLELSTSTSLRQGINTKIVQETRSALTSSYHTIR